MIKKIFFSCAFIFIFATKISANATPLVTTNSEKSSQELSQLLEQSYIQHHNATDLSTIYSIISEDNKINLNTLVKKVNVVRISELFDNKTSYTQAAVKVFDKILNPYWTSNPTNPKILQRITWSCSINDNDPTNNTQKLDFPIKLNNSTTWNRYKCRFILSAPCKNNCTSPYYYINQIDYTGNLKKVRPAVAFQNLTEPKYKNYIGRYVQSLPYLLRNNLTDNSSASNALLGVNGGYDYRIDQWKPYSLQDNVCFARYSKMLDVGYPIGTPEFYNHPAPRKCPMNDIEVPTCTHFPTMRYGNMGDSVVYLSEKDAGIHSRFQSQNCGQIRTNEMFSYKPNFSGYARGAFIEYNNGSTAFMRTAASNNPASLGGNENNQGVYSAIGAGPLLIKNGQFTYHDPISEEGLPLNNYEIGSVTGIDETTSGYHLVVVDGKDLSIGMHNWILGLYFMHTPIYDQATHTIHYEPANNALTLGNAGDSAMWINPTFIHPAVGSANYNFLNATFKLSGATGVVSNCDYSHSGKDHAPSCNNRPVHDGLFIYSDK